MMKFTYEILMPEHAEAWQELQLEGVREFPMGFLVTIDETISTSLERCREVLGYRGMRGVFTEETLVGFCGYRPQRLARIRHRAEIGPFFITRSFQGLGAAKTLLAGVIEEARSNGIAQIELFVDTENSRAVAFYEGQGFERIATHYDSVRIDGQSRNHFFMVLRM